MSKRKMTIDDLISLPWHYSTEASVWEGQKGYWISVAELPDCATFATNLGEGMATIPSLLREYLKVALVSRAEISAPETSDDLTLAGNLSLRIPVSLHMGVKNAARLQKTSINQFAIKALTEAVTRTSKPSLLGVRESASLYNAKKSKAGEKRTKAMTKKSARSRSQKSSQDL